MATNPPANQESTSASDAASVYLLALVPIIAWFMQREPEDYTYAIRNTEDCWYAPTCAIMTDLVPRLALTNELYSKDTAAADSAASTQAIFDEFKDTALAKVYFPQCIANGYNATTAQLLANAAYAKTVSEANKNKLDWTTRYAGIRVQDLNVMSQLIQAIKNSKTVGNIAENYNQNTINALTGIGELGASLYDRVTSDNGNPTNESA